MVRHPRSGSPITRSLACLLMAACGGEGPTETAAQVTGVTVTATPNPAALTATARATATVLPAGVSQSVRWSSSDEDVATVDGTGLVTPRLRGTVTITATSTVDVSHSGSVTLDVVCPAPRVVADHISDATTWENWVPDPECFDYVVHTDVEGSADVLTIEAGTIVGFEEDRGLRIRGAGTLIAVGTAEDPIVLTGTTEERGWWDGLALEFSSHDDNVLTHVSIEYTGGHAISNTDDAGLIMVGDFSAQIDSSTFRESEGYGVFLSADSRITGSGGNVLTANALGSASVYGTAVPGLRDAILTGNDVDIVYVHANTITEAATWPSATYHITLTSGNASFAVREGGELTLTAGSTLRFEADLMLLVQAGGLSAVGTAENPIVLTGTEPVRGHWAGLGFVATAHPMNRLEHVVVEYGGGDNIGGALETADVVLVGSGPDAPSRVEIVRSTFRRSEQYGLWADRDAELPSFEDNTLTENTLGAAWVHAPVVDALRAGTYSGNDIDEIAVEAGVSNQLDTISKFRDLGVPYHLQYHIGEVWEVNSPLTLEPGVEMLMAPGLGVTIQLDGSMTAVGLPDDDRLISIRGKAGPWMGLDFHDTTGTFAYFEIEDAGIGSWGGAPGGTFSVRASEAEASVVLGERVATTDEGYTIVFSFGASYVYGCRGSVYTPPGETGVVHCR